MGGDGAGPEQELEGTNPKYCVVSHPLMLLLARLFLQALIPYDSSKTKQTQLLCNTHIKDSFLQESHPMCKAFPTTSLLSHSLSPQIHHRHLCCQHGPWGLISWGNPATGEAILQQQIRVTLHPAQGSKQNCTWEASRTWDTVMESCRAAHVI